MDHLSAHAEEEVLIANAQWARLERILHMPGTARSPDHVELREELKLAIQLHGVFIAVLERWARQCSLYDRPREEQV